MAELKLSSMEGNVQRVGAMLMADNPSADTIVEARAAIANMNGDLSALRASDSDRGPGFEARSAALAASAAELQTLAEAKSLAAPDKAGASAGGGAGGGGGGAGRAGRALTRMVSEAPGQGECVHREGFLRKRNQKGGWGKRWCVLEGGSFLYYSSREAAAPAKKTGKPAKPRGHVPITGTSKLTREPGDDALNFQVLTAERAYEMHAETNADMMGWLQALKENLAVLRNRVTSL